MPAPKKPAAEKPAPKKPAAKDDIEERLSALEAKVAKLGKEKHPAVCNVQDLEKFEEKLRAWLMDAPLLKISIGVLVVVLVLILF